MNRIEAVNYLREFLQSNTGLSPNAITFEELADRTSYSIKIKTSEVDKLMIIEKAKDCGLAAKEENGDIVIFTP